MAMSLTISLGAEWGPAMHDYSQPWVHGCHTCIPTFRRIITLYTHIYIHTHTHTHTHYTYTHTHRHTHIHTRTYTHMLTHIPLSTHIHMVIQGSGSPAVNMQVTSLSHSNTNCHHICYGDTSLIRVLKVDYQ